MTELWTLWIQKGQRKRAFCPFFRHYLVRACTARVRVGIKSKFAQSVSTTHPRRGSAPRRWRTPGCRTGSTRAPRRMQSSGCSPGRSDTTDTSDGRIATSTRRSCATRQRCTQHRFATCGKPHCKCIANRSTPVLIICFFKNDSLCRINVIIPLILQQILTQMCRWKARWCQKWNKLCSRYKALLTSSRRNL